MSELWHIIDRYVYHTGWAIVLVGIFFFGLLYWAMRNEKVAAWVSTDPRHVLVTAALLVAAIMPLREPYDLIMGNQVPAKTPFDQASWWIGAALGAWLFWRLFKFLRRIRLEKA